MKKAQKYLTDLYVTFVRKPLYSNIMVLLFALLILLFIPKIWYDSNFKQNVLVEFYGLIGDIIFLGIIAALLSRANSKNQTIIRYKEEIDDYREWKSDEAKYRLKGLVSRLHKLGVCKIDLSRCYFPHLKFDNYKLTGSDFSEANISGSSFNNSDLEEANFSCNYDVQRLTWVHFRNSNLKKSKFRSIWLDNSDFTESNLGSADFFSSTLENTSFSLTKLEKACFWSSQIKNVSFQGSYMKEVDFHESIFENSEFTNAKIIKGNFKNCGITSECSFYNAIIISSDFTGIRGLSHESISRAKTLYDCKFSTCIEKRLKEKYPRLFEKPDFEIS